MGALEWGVVAKTTEQQSNTRNGAGGITPKLFSTSGLCSSMRTESESQIRVTGRGRLVAAVVALGCGGLLAVAGWVRPAANGIGTHRQLGLPACGFYERTGYPCPTCHMTTAFSLSVRGRLVGALATQPAGALAAVVTFLAAVTGGYVVGTGRVPEWVRRISVKRVGVMAVGVVVVAWLWLCALTWLGRA